MSKKSAPYAMILPYFLLYVAFGLFPILFSLGVSFTSWDGIGEMTFGAEKLCAGIYAG